MAADIKVFLKKSSVLSSLGYKYREFYTHFHMKRFSKCSLEKNKIVFATTGGRFHDSCKQMALYLHRTNPEINIIWVRRGKSHLEEFPDFVTTVLFNSAEYFKEISVASVWVFDFLIPQGTIKKDGQFYIQVWHGDKGFKRFASNSTTECCGHKSRKSSESELCDLFVTGSEFFASVWRKTVGYQGKIINKGLPRNDLLLKDDKKTRDKLKSFLKVPKDSLVLMYAPTFRDHQIDYGQIGSDINLNQVLNMLKKKSGTEWVCLMRAHGGTHIYLDNTNIGLGTNMIDVTEYPDMTELLTISDILITDYSSCAGDFALTGKAVILYQDDYLSYTTNDRGLLFKIEDSPYLVAHNMDELEKIIMGLSDKDISKNDDDILKFYGSTQMIDSTERVCKIILEHILGENV